MNSKVKKTLKISGITLGVILILLIVLPFIFKGKIIEQVKKEINKSVNAKVDWTDVDLTLFRSFPNFSLGLENLSVVGVDQFAGDTLVGMKKMYVSIDLFSVISGDNYEIEGITLTKPNINLKVEKDGKANWDITKPSETPQDTTKSEPSKFKLSLKKVMIEDGNIRYNDKQSNMSAEVLGLNHTLKGDLTASTTDIRTKTTIKELTFVMDGVAYLNKGAADVKFDMNADLDKMSFKFLDNSVKLNELSMQFEGFFEMPENGYNMDIKLKTPNTEFKNILSMVPAIFMKDFDKIKTEGSFEMSAFAKGKMDSLNLPAFEVNLKVKNAMFKYPDLPKAVNNIQVAAKISNKGGNADNTIIDVKQFHVEMAGNPFDMSMYVSTPISDPNIDVKAKGKVDMNIVKDFYPMEKDQKLTGVMNADLAFAGRMSMLDKKQYEKFKATGLVELKNFFYADKDLPKGVTVSNAALKFTPQYAELTSLNVTMEQSDFNATGKVENFIPYMFDKGDLKGLLTVNSNYFNVNQFLSDEPATATPAPESDTASALTTFDVPKNIDFTLRSNFKKVVYDKLDINNLNGTIQVVDQKVMMNNVGMNVLDGQIKMNGSYSSKSVQPDAAFNFALNGLDIQKTWKAFAIMKKVAPIAKYATGKFSTSFDYKSSLDKTMTPVWKTVNVSGNLKTAAVSIIGSNLFNQVADVSKIAAFKKVNFNNISIRYKIADGKVTTEPFDVTFDNVKSTISGTTSLDQTIDYTLKMQVPRKAFGSAANDFVNSVTGKITQAGVNVNMSEILKFDIKIGGTFTKPVIKTGLRDAAGNVVDNVKDAVKDEINKKKDEVIADVKVEVNKALDDAQKRADAMIAEARKQAENIKAEAKKAGDKVIAETDAQGKKLIAEAKNPIAKVAAEQTAKTLNKEAKDKAAKLNKEAEDKSNNLINKAKADGDKLIEEARGKAR